MAASTDGQPDGMTQVHAMAPSVFHHRGLRGRRTDVDTNANLGVPPLACDKGTVPLSHYRQTKWILLASKCMRNMAKTVGFIGSGNMGRAIIGGMIAAGFYTPSQILASARTKETVEKIEKELGIAATTDNATVAKKADILFLAVKPGVFATVIPEIRDCCKEGQILHDLTL